MLPDARDRFRAPPDGITSLKSARAGLHGYKDVCHSPDSRDSPQWAGSIQSAAALAKTISSSTRTHPAQARIDILLHLVQGGFRRLHTPRVPAGHHLLSQLLPERLVEEGA
jgi:hypothetical protein